MATTDSTIHSSRFIGNCIMPPFQPITKPSISLLDSLATTIYQTNREGCYIELLFLCLLDSAFLGLTPELFYLAHQYQQTSQEPSCSVFSFVSQLGRQRFQ